jgi:hypothetical protein
MGWASAAIEQLMRGETVHVRPRGHSMTGRVNDGDKVTVMPLGTRDPDVGDVVLVRCRGHEYLHLVKARQGDRFLSATTPAIFGVATQIEPWRAR